MWNNELIIVNETSIDRRHNVYIFIIFRKQTDRHTGSKIESYDRSKNLDHYPYHFLFFFWMSYVSPIDDKNLNKRGKLINSYLCFYFHKRSSLIIKVMNIFALVCILFIFNDIFHLLGNEESFSRMLIIVTFFPSDHIM